MKKIIFIISTILLFLPSGYSQGVTRTVIGKDTAYQKLIKEIPPGWSVSVNKDFLTIEKKEPVWILAENKINAPLNRESEAERIQRIKKYGRLSKTKLVFLVTEKWDQPRVRKAEKHNREINRRILTLPKKYNIEKLYDKSLSRKGTEYFIGNNPSDEKRIKSYRAEKASLEKQLIPLPDYNLKNNSLFLKEQSGLEDEYHTIYPETTPSELALVKNKLNEISKSSY
jgi:hypothetical protein